MWWNPDLEKQVSWFNTSRNKAPIITKQKTEERYIFFVLNNQSTNSILTHSSFFNNRVVQVSNTRLFIKSKLKHFLHIKYRNRTKPTQEKKGFPKPLQVIKCTATANWSLAYDRRLLTHSKSLSCDQNNSSSDMMWVSKKDYSVTPFTTGKSTER